MSATSIRVMFFERKKHIADVWGSPVSQIGNIFLGTQITKSSFDSFVVSKHNNESSFLSM